MHTLIIDNHVVEFNNYLSIIPINRYKKCLHNVPIKHFGSKYNDNKILSDLASGIIQFNDIYDYFIISKL